MKTGIKALKTVLRGACVLLWGLLMLASCKHQGQTPPVAVEATENMEAKQLLQGTWMDELTEEVSFVCRGDTIFFMDGTSLPAYFRIVGDSIVLGGNAYHIRHQSGHVFAFENQAGDEVKLVKRDEQPGDSIEVPHTIDVPPIVTEVVNRDSVVMFNGERYHWYVTINPTRKRVNRTAYNSDGVSVENVYYDNIIHVSLFQGRSRIFGRDFNKQMFAGNVPSQFLEQAILGNIQFLSAERDGFHFSATLCIPDEASCYMVEIVVAQDGSVSMKLMEY